MEQSLKVDFNEKRISPCPNNIMSTYKAPGAEASIIGILYAGGLLTLGIAGSGAVAIIANNIGNWINNKQSFGDGTTPANKKRSEEGFGSYIDDNGNLVETFMRQQGYETMRFMSQEDSGVSLSRANRTRSGDGNVRTTHLEFDVGGRANPYERSVDVINFSYGTPPEHESTDLNEGDLEQLIIGTYSEIAYALEPEATVACGRLIMAVNGMVIMRSQLMETVVIVGCGYKIIKTFLLVVLMERNQTVETTTIILNIEI